MEVAAPVSPLQALVVPPRVAVALPATPPTQSLCGPRVMARTDVWGPWRAWTQMPQPPVRSTPAAGWREPGVLPAAPTERSAIRHHPPPPTAARQVLTRSWLRMRRVGVLREWAEMRLRRRRPGVLRWAMCGAPHGLRETGRRVPGCARAETRRHRPPAARLWGAARGPRSPRCPSSFSAAEEARQKTRMRFPVWVWLPRLAAPCAIHAPRAR